jgi:molybdenum cofactor sulfurtransferase
MTMKHDVDKLINMLTSYFVQGSPVRKLPEWWPGFQKAYAQKYQSVLGKCNGPINVDSVKTPAILNVRQTFKMPSPINIMSQGMLDRNSIMLTDIYVYPVKSCGAMRMESCVIGSRGFLYDREWMVVTPAGVCLTQKQDTKLCLIQPSIDLSRRLLILQFPGKSHSTAYLYTCYICYLALNEMEA